MSKKVINQNTNYDSELLNSIGSNFIFDENPINRMKNATINQKKEGEINGLMMINYIQLTILKMQLPMIK